MNLNVLIDKVRLERVKMKTIFTIWTVLILSFQLFGSKNEIKVLLGKGFYKEAIPKLEKFIEDNSMTVNDYRYGLIQLTRSLQRLNRVREIDHHLEKGVLTHSSHWEKLWVLAKIYLEEIPHYGKVESNQFIRGNYRRGVYHQVNQHDQDRALSLYYKAYALMIKEKKIPKKLEYDFLRSYARSLAYFQHGPQRAYHYLLEANFNSKPIYTEKIEQVHIKYAPVSRDGNLIIYEMPEYLEKAKNIGSCWVYLLRKASLLNTDKFDHLWDQASFYQNLYGVQTINSYSMSRHNKIFNQVFKFIGLSDSKFIAQCSQGIIEFELPQEMNYIHLLKKIGLSEGAYREKALMKLYEIYLNRRQYEKAALRLEECILHFGDKKKYKSKLKQIRGNWFKFDTQGLKTQTKKFSLPISFRNAQEIEITAHKVNTKKLISDVKSYFKSQPERMQWDKVHISNLGWRLIQKNQKQYIGKEVLKWKQKLLPQEKHLLSSGVVKNKLNKFGTYLITAKVKGGNTSRLILWVPKHALVKAMGDKNIHLFIAESETGKPSSNIELNLFSYQQNYARVNKQGKHIQEIKVYEENYTSNEEGVVMIPLKRNNYHKNYLYVVGENTESPSYLGFENIWEDNWYHQSYHEKKGFGITDKPVYQPTQKVKFHYWLSQVDYLNEENPYRHAKVTLYIRDPRGNEVLKKEYTTDSYGGFEGELSLTKNSVLGNYRMFINGINSHCQFRVEEYKRPEYEVKIMGPTKGISLGEDLSVRVQAKYYFGSPVQNAKLKLKVYRREVNEEWFLPSPWDWLYGNGYGWTNSEAHWHPNWRQWSCLPPRPWWYHKPIQKPELVYNLETKLNNKGEYSFKVQTALAKKIFGDKDQKYEVVTEVIDASRRTISSKKSFFLKTKPFELKVWTSQSYYHQGQEVKTFFSTRTNSSFIETKATIKLYELSHHNEQIEEKLLMTWQMNDKRLSVREHRFKVPQSGQYKIEINALDNAKKSQTTATIFNVYGNIVKESKFQYNSIELLTDKVTYSEGETCFLRINTQQLDSTVVLYVKPSQGVYHKPKIIQLKNKTTLEKIPIDQKDMPNFFFEAYTVFGSQIHKVIKEVYVPPVKKSLHISLKTDQMKYLPGGEVEVDLLITDSTNNPVKADLVLAVYDKSIEYISGGSNIPEIKSYFWKWRRRHEPSLNTNLDRYMNNLYKRGEEQMRSLGLFGDMMKLVESNFELEKRNLNKRKGINIRHKVQKAASSMMASYEEVSEEVEFLDVDSHDIVKTENYLEKNKDFGNVSIRTNLSDQAYWKTRLVSDEYGKASVKFSLPEGLSSWKLKAWALSEGTRVGEVSHEIITHKPLMIRPQLPRFLVEGDEIVLTALINSSIDLTQECTAQIDFEGDNLKLLETNKFKNVVIEGQDEGKVEWKVKALREGDLTARFKVMSKIANDGVEMQFPIYVHGSDIMKTESAVLNKDSDGYAFKIEVPHARRIESTRLSIKASTSLLTSVISSLPYLVEYPYGCTEQTLNRFLPTLMVFRFVKTKSLDLNKSKNLNGKYSNKNNPVFNSDQINEMVRVGVKRLVEMQNSDGGWGWFFGAGGKSYPHTTATVVRGLLKAKDCGVQIDAPVLNKGLSWLMRYQREQVSKIEKATLEKTKHTKHYTDSLDAFIFMILSEAGSKSNEMKEYLYRDRLKLNLYSKIMVALALIDEKEDQYFKDITRQIEQYVKVDDELQLCSLEMNNDGFWWHWYGNSNEAHAYYLKLLSKLEPNSLKTSYLVKTIMNERKYANRWQSTRDTALCIESLLDYDYSISNDDNLMSIDVYHNGEIHSKHEIQANSHYDGEINVLFEGEDLKGGLQNIEIRKKGKGPLYVSGQLNTFSLENFIKKEGRELVVSREIYKVVENENKLNQADQYGNVSESTALVESKLKIENNSTVKSGEVYEIQLIVESAYDCEYVLLEDFKAAGFESIFLQSGYQHEGLRAYVEYRNEKACFFIRKLPKGIHTFKYRLRAEIPGKFSALPAKIYAMYSPELKGNSNEFKVKCIE